MPVTGARRGNLIYHWKHGWIPLDHFAALSKAKGSHRGAEKIMHQRNITHDHKDHPKLVARGDLRRSPHITAVHAPGGNVIVRDSKSGHAVKLNTGHAASLHSQGHTITAVHEHGITTRSDSGAITKRGTDTRALESHSATPSSNNTPVAAAKRVQVEHSGDGTILHFGRDDTQAREAAKSVGARWSRNLGAWYLPRTQTESTRRYKVSQLEAKLGHENVHVADMGHGKTTTAAEREAARKAASAVRAERLGARAAKHEAEAEARYKAAKDIMDRIPLGQPILVGHHSERGARADQKRIHSHSDKMVEAMAKAKADQRAAEAARHNATSADSPLKRQRRIDKNQADIRAIDRKLTEHSIALKAPDAAAKVGIRPLPPDYHAKLTAQRAELADQVAHDKAQIEASGFQGVNPANVTPGDMIQYRGRTHIVAKVNKTTFSVPTPYSWEDKVPINQATKHIPLSTQSDSAIENAYRGATNPHVKAALAKELKKRGLTIPSV